MRVVIHVGAHKTGTSLVQKYFRDNPDVNKSLDIAFIERNDESNELIGWGGAVARQPQLLRTRLVAELARGPTAVLFSHENILGRPIVEGRAGLYPDAPTLARALADACEGLDVTIIHYVRPIASFIESYYVQTIHEGAWHTFDEWYATLDPDGLRWGPTIAGLDAAFGAERVLLGDFDEIGAGQNEFLRRFINRAGLPIPADVSYRPIRNASVSARGLQMALAMNKYLATIEERRAVRKFLQGHFSNRREERARPMPEQVRRDLADRTAAEYATLAARAAQALAPPEDPPRGVASPVSDASQPRSATRGPLPRRLLGVQAYRQGSRVR